MSDKDISILVVEDEIIAREYLVAILESLGFSKVCEASSSNEALEIIKEETIGLTFMDINIDGKIDGIGCSRLLNEHYDIPTIYTTAYKDSGTISDAKESNIFGYIAKPFYPNDIEATLGVALKLIKSINYKKSSEQPKTSILYFDHNQSYNLQTQSLYVNSKAVELTKKESMVLFLLCKNLNELVSYELLKEYIWKDKNISNSTIRDTLSRLKRKVPDLFIENRINMGYILKT